MQKLQKILVQKLPRDKNGDLIFDVDEAKDIHNNAVQMLRRSVGLDVLTTFADIDAVDTSDRNSGTSIDDLQKIERSVYNAFGISNNLFNTDGNLALEKSVLNDESNLRNLLLQFNIFFDRVACSLTGNKYYKFKVLEQIDFNRLLKFKEATVVFHCQPFKYPVSETPITISGETTVNNAGNIYAMPTLNIIGSGTIGITLNGTQIFSIDLGESTTPITIDTAMMEAYNTSNTELMNRQVTGDYSLFKILSGNNTIEISGTVSQATISNYTRWL